MLLRKVLGSVPRADGTWAVDLYAIMNTILNSVVLMSIATYIVTLIAKYASPCGIAPPFVCPSNWCLHRGVWSHFPKVISALLSSPPPHPDRRIALETTLKWMLFARYQDTSVKPAEMIARTASVAAVRVGHIMKIFDPQQSGIVDPRWQPMSNHMLLCC